MELTIIILFIYLGIIVLMSLLAIILYGKDKKMAVKNSGPNRIKESKLLGVAAFGGAIGAFIARLLFHHKTDKSYFSLTIYFSLLLQIITAAALIYLAFGGAF